MGSEVNVVEKVKGLVSEHLGCSAESVVEDARLEEDLGATETSRADLVLSLMSSFGIADPAASVKTVGDLVDQVRLKVGDSVREIIAERLARDIEEVSDSADFMEDLRADSLDLTELLMALEDEFDIEIDDDSNEIKTVGQAIEYIREKIPAPVKKILGELLPEAGDNASDDAEIESLGADAQGRSRLLVMVCQRLKLESVETVGDAIAFVESHA